MLREIPTRCWLGLVSENPFVRTDRNCLTTFARNESAGNMRTVISENHFRWADPTKWPWVVYFWLAAITVGYAKPVWRWLQRNRAKNWPIAEGRFESADVDEKKWFSPSVSFRSRSAKHIAKLGYSYSVAGTTYSGTHKREFEVEGEAWEFVRELKGSAVTVQYNPKKPSVSILLEQSIETFQQTRPPVPFTDSTQFAATDSVPLSSSPSSGYLSVCPLLACSPVCMFISALSWVATSRQNRFSGFFTWASSLFGFRQFLWLTGASAARDEKITGNLR
jgi:hypothetical protein